MASPKPTKYIPPIDGLRAIAVTAVILYHLGIKWLPGGFLGVDLFFVISGYVITRLILDSIDRSSALDLREFYLARMRRLFPALFGMILGSTAIIAAFAPDGAKRFFSDIPYVVTGTNNWRLVARHQDYFETIGRPPLLQHTWSLAVEAQFYLLWPIILLAVLRYFGKKNLSKAALVIALVSGFALFFFSLHGDTASSSSISHIYFGTDTHSLGLFLGAALAVSWVPANLTLKITERAQDFVDFIGVFGLLGLLGIFLFIDESNPSLYRIAFPLAGIFGCAIIISLVHPASRFAPLITTRPFIWVGERSYGIYLWHWVIFQVTRPNIDLVGSDFALNLVRILIVLALADISLRYLEIPIRRGVLATWLRGLKYRTVKVRKKAKRRIIGVCLVILLITSGSTSVAWYRADRLPVPLTLEERAQLNSAVISATDPLEKKGLWVTGDSVILGIRQQLDSHFHIALMNARVGRQIKELIEVVRADQPQVPKSTVVLDLGNNNRLLESEVRILFELLKTQPKIIVVNTAVPRGWVDENNAIIAKVSADYRQAVLVNWAEISRGHPEFFAPDGVHLDVLGGEVYVAAILDHLP